MGCFLKFKIFLVSLTVFYTLYLSTYKCPEVKAHPLEQSAKSIFDPLSSTHKHVCGALDKAHLVATPYAEKAQAVLHYHSRDLLHKYDVPSKFELTKAHFYTHVHPYVVKVWKFTECAELHLFHHGYKAYTHLENHFHSTVVPKASEFKDAVADHAESLKDEIQSKLE